MGCGKGKPVHQSCFRSVLVRDAGFLSWSVNNSLATGDTYAVQKQTHENRAYPINTCAGLCTRGDLATAAGSIWRGF